MKKLLVMLLCAVMMTTFMPAMAFAADDVPESPNTAETADTAEGESVEAGGETAETAGTVNTAEALQAAIASVEDGGTITLGADITGSIVIDQAKTFTLDLGTYTLSGQVKIDNPNADVTIVGTANEEGNSGTITYNGAVTDNATVFVKAGKAVLNNVIVKATAQNAGSVGVAVYGALETNGGAIISDNGYGIGFFDSATAQLNGTDVTAMQNPISTNVSGKEVMDVKINGGTYKCTHTGTGWSYVGIYWASHGKLTIDNGTFTSHTTDAAGLYVKNGTIIINGGNFQSTKDGVKITSEESNSTEIDVTINDGVFNGSRTGLYVKTNASGKAEDNYTVKVKDGTFNGDDYSFYSSLAGFEPKVDFQGGEFKNIFKTSLKKFITGGHYSFNPNDEVEGLEYVADGYKADGNDRIGYTVKPI